MNSSEQLFERMNQRAWAAAYDALESAENQGRTIAAKRYRYVMSVLSEIRAGEDDRAKLKQMRLRYEREERERRAREAIHD